MMNSTLLKVIMSGNDIFYSNDLSLTPDSVSSKYCDKSIIRKIEDFYGQILNKKCMRITGAQIT